jgi:hypothetical protein
MTTTTTITTSTHMNPTTNNNITTNKVCYFDDPKMETTTAVNMTHGFMNILSNLKGSVAPFMLRLMFLEGMSFVVPSASIEQSSLHGAEVITSGREARLMF